MDHRVLLLHVLNFLDAIFTLVAVRAGVPEANPVMAFFLSLSPELFLFVKFTILTIGIEFLRRKLGKSYGVVINSLLIVFLTVVAWHVYWLFIGGPVDGT